MLTLAPKSLFSALSSALFAAVFTALFTALLAGCGALTAAPVATVTVTVTAPSSEGAEGTEGAENSPENPAVNPAAGTVANAGATAASATSSALPTAAAREAQAFAEGFETVRKRLSGPASVALIPVGGGRLLAAGETDAPVAWSTSKVPLAIAALRLSRSAQTRKDVTAALRDSDNPASARLWTRLGGGERASARMEAVLRDAGDTETQVPPGRSRPPFSSFGQMAWRTRDAALFAANLSCIPDSGPVLAHMRRVTDTQQWGFWDVDGAAVKGGWGPVDDEYLVRQIAVVPVAGGGSVGAAIAVLAPTFEQGTSDATVIAEWAAAFAEPMGATC